MAESKEEPGIDRYHRRFSAGAKLFYAGAPATDVYLIRAGSVRLHKRARGIERTTGVYGSGEIIGEEALLEGAHRTATAEAIDPVSALVVDGDTFRALSRRRPEVGEGAMKQLVRRLLRAEEQLENAMLADPTTRVLNSLLQAIDASGDGRLPLSPLELSTRTGLELDQVKAIVEQLSKRGYLDVGDQTITVENPTGLRQLRELLAIKEEVGHRFACR